ncbi:MAG: hypothetical protein HRF43_20620 [Phycisphaerae bacterium]|jgi:hypothetical protein
MLAHVEFTAHTKVKPAQPGPPPEDVKWVKDIRLNPRTRKQLIEGFFGDHRGIFGHVAYVANESDRERLRKEGKLMVQISDLSAQHVTIIAPMRYFKPA